MSAPGVLALVVIGALLYIALGLIAGRRGASK